MGRCVKVVVRVRVDHIACLWTTDQYGRVEYRVYTRRFILLTREGPQDDMYAAG